MSYKSALSYLDGLQSTNIKLGLERIHAVCAALDHPERKFPSIIVAGTNGKGSTCAFLESILRHHGSKVGLYTSPHLFDVRERIQINRGVISEEEFARLVERLSVAPLESSNVRRRTAVERKPFNVSSRATDKRLTYFELLTAMAFQYFATAGVDIAVLEVGLGGRFDATNLVTPLVSVITRIGLDHQKYLGDTIEKIAFEKCGIIKEGVPVVTVDQSASAMSVIREAADKNRSMLHIVSSHEIPFPLGLIGRHQLENAALAVRAAEIVLPLCKGELEGVDTALASTRWPGRLEIVHKNPLVILDGAHNPNGAEALAKYLLSLRSSKKRIIILLGIMADKDMAGIIRPLAEVADEVIFTRPEILRAADPAVLLKMGLAPFFRKRCLSHFPIFKVIEPLSRAISQTISTMSEADVLIIAGSLYTVGEAKRFFRDLET